ncbi:hypothetical protein VTN31DRAFT_5347 [Thermomyces dupontii]|uniref:uncharacterized protein n=1 Tax=Talaromyces thermophilus TaxID=28565 RepID=UPI0037420EBD
MQSQVYCMFQKSSTQYILFLIQPASDHSLSNKIQGFNELDPQVKCVLSKYERVFQTELPKELPPERLYDHEINTSDAKSMNVNTYPLSQIHLEELKCQLEELLAAGLVHPSASAWGFSVLFAQKLGGAWRMCINYQVLNCLTVRNRYPLLQIQTMLDMIRWAHYISKLNLLSGYWQV